MFGSAGPSVVAFCAQELSGERNSFIALKEVSNLSHMFAAEDLIVQVLRVEGALRFFDLAYEGEWIYAFGESEIGSVFTDRPALYGLDITQKKKESLLPASHKGVLFSAKQPKPICPLHTRTCSLIPSLTEAGIREIRRP